MVRGAQGSFRRFASTSAVKAGGRDSLALASGFDTVLLKTSCWRCALTSHLQRMCCTDLPGSSDFEGAFALLWVLCWAYVGQVRVLFGHCRATRHYFSNTSHATQFAVRLPHCWLSDRQWTPDERATRMGGGSDWCTPLMLIWSHRSSCWGFIQGGVTGLHALHAFFY